MKLMRRSSRISLGSNGVIIPLFTGTFSALVSHIANSYRPHKV